MKRYPVKRSVLTQKRLKELLIYNPKTGIFKWKNGKQGRKKNLIAGHKKENGYIIIQIDYESYPASKLAWLYMNGYLPEYIVDHIDRIRDNNKWNNLRLVTKSENSMNISMPKNNKSGIIGVYYSNLEKKWKSHICVYGTRISIGTFETKYEAAKARLEAEIAGGFKEYNEMSSAYLYLKENGGI